MQIPAAVEIEEVAHAYDTEWANTLLRKGWVLLGVFQATDTSDDIVRHEPVYSLGRPRTPL